MSSLLVTFTKHRERRRSWFRRVVVGLALGSASMGLAYLAFYRWTMVVGLATDHSPAGQPVAVERGREGPRLVLGRSWLERRAGIRQGHLIGSPTDIGLAHGQLLGRLHAERDLQRNICDRCCAAASAAVLSRNLFRLRLSRASEALSPAERIELTWLSRAAGWEFSKVLCAQSIYLSAAFEQRAGDDLHRSQFGSSTLALWGSRTLNGGILIGRNFHYGRVTLTGSSDEDPAPTLLVMRPTGRLPFISLAWPGFTGVVSGVNQARVFIALNPAATDDTTYGGGASSLLARRILERAGNISHALKLIDETPLAAAVSFFIADGKTTEVAVVEVSPKRRAVRRSTRAYLVATDHFMHPDYRSDAHNDHIRRYTPSHFRFQRLKKIIGRAGRGLDAGRVAKIMRDRYGSRGQRLAFGHAGAVDNIGATHSFILDLQKLIIWINRGPHVLGEFEPVDLKPLFGEAVEAGPEITKLPVDSGVGLADRRMLDLVRAQLRYSELLVAADKLELALEYAQRAVKAAPTLPRAQLALADLLWRMEQNGAAGRHYLRYLDLDPPFRNDVERAKERLAK